MILNVIFDCLYKKFCFIVLSNFLNIKYVYYYGNLFVLIKEYNNVFKIFYF